MNVISHDRLREHMHRVSSPRGRDALRHRADIFLPNAPLASVGVPRDVRVEAELSMSGLAHGPCHGVDRPRGHAAGLTKTHPESTDPGAMPRGSEEPGHRAPPPYPHNSLTSSLTCGPE